MSANEADKILKKIDRSRLPAHVAIIMDGNGRWARRRRLPRLIGHQRGSRTVRRVVEMAGELGIRVLTLYAFSTENWARPRTEINGLMRLLRQTLKREEDGLNRNNVRLGTIGDLTKLPDDVRAQLQETKNRLARNTGLHLVLALNYGGRQEIIRACNEAIAAGHMRITEETIAKHLFTKDLPDPDLLIRTSGEQRVSNFLLWQIAYTEFVSTPVLWPDFDRKDFYGAVLEFQSRDRRYGGVA